MRLVRVQVPEFRALKDVDIRFEPEFTPQVFPLGSLNGGGKSTLLQLIFVLLNIKTGTDKFHQIKESFFRNVLIDELHSAQLQTIKGINDLAVITLLSSDNTQITLHFYYGNLDDADKLIKGDDNLVKFFSYFYDDGDGNRFGFIGIAYIEGETVNHAEIIDLIDTIRKKIILISPSNQSYLFATQEERRLLYTSDGEKSYDQVIKRLKNDYPNFYTYDFIDVLTEVCRLARDKDFDEKLKTGVYGTHYEQLENAINSLFIDGKKIIPLTVDQKRHTKDSIQSMGFKLPSGEEIYPEDLSHGELKRLAIFVLIKYHEIHDAIVLMDEIENGFHPDWQYQIVHDLVEWGENNQYILATHSYELCNALTPAHVKELDPKLVKN